MNGQGDLLNGSPSRTTRHDLAEAKEENDDQGLEKKPLHSRTGMVVSRMQKAYHSGLKGANTLRRRHRRKGRNENDRYAMTQNDLLSEEEDLDSAITEATLNNHVISGAVGNDEGLQYEYMQSSPIKQEDRGVKPNLRLFAAGMPEVHFLGDIQYGLGFQGCSVSCQWTVEWGDNWSFLEGSFDGQSQYSILDEGGVGIWNHPIDLHFASANMKGWPRIKVRIWELDKYGRTVLAAYGFSHLPSQPGRHTIQVKCWRPQGTKFEEIRQLFLGTSTMLSRESLLFEDAWESRHRLVTISSGQVIISVSTILRFFDEQGVE